MGCITDEILQLINGRETLVKASLESDLYYDLGLDSLGFVSLLVEVENHFDIQFGLDEMNQCLKVRRLIEIATKKVEKKE